MIIQRKLHYLKMKDINNEYHNEEEPITMPGGLFSLVYDLRTGHFFRCNHRCQSRADPQFELINYHEERQKMNRIRNWMLRNSPLNHNTIHGTVSTVYVPKRYYYTSGINVRQAWENRPEGYTI